MASASPAQISPLPSSSASPKTVSTLTDPNIWLGEWSNGQYSCTVGEKLSNDKIRIEKGEKADEFKLTLYLNTVLPATVMSRQVAPDHIDIPEQELNGGPASGSLNWKDGSLTLNISTLAGWVTCQEKGYHK